MKLQKDQHLTYCTNIHPGSDWSTTFDSLREYVPDIKKKVAKDQPFGLGLRLSNKASEELNEGQHLSQFKQWLDTLGIYVFTMNGFPYGNFHNERVKDNVHAPDWTTRERVSYTKRLFNQLSVLLPDGVEGGISTSPISYKHWFSSESEIDNAFVKGANAITEIILHLYHLEKSTGKYMHLDIEPEPDGLIENSDELIMFFKDYLIPIASQVIENTLGKQENALQLVHKYITICYDICHFSLAYEEPEDTFKKLNSAGIKIGKIQVSAALKIISDKIDNSQIWEALEAFNEPTYLHQVTELKDGRVHTYNDLPMLLENKNDFKELRAHFHVPIFLEKFGQLWSTQDHIEKVVDILKKEAISNHLEIETYTWEVLPNELKKELSESIIRELEWLISKL